MMRRHDDPDSADARADRAHRLAQLLIEQADADIEAAGGVEMFRDRRRVPVFKQPEDGSIVVAGTALTLRGRG